MAEQALTDGTEHRAFQRLPGRRVELNTRSRTASGDDALQPDAMVVERFLPTRGRRMVGAFCFVDRFGPDDVNSSAGMRVAPHPHTGLQTVTWLLEGDVLHLDSVGSRQVIRPCELNLMTAGRGISHSEESPPDHADVLHGLQLWVALPSGSLQRPPDFEHHEGLPVLELPGARATVVMGTLGGTTSPATTHTPLVAADVHVDGGRDGHGHGDTVLPLDPTWEYAVLPLAGGITVEGEEVDLSELLYLGTGRGEVAVGVSDGGRRDGARLLLVGGEPFGEEILMWWNFVGRTHDEVEQARAQWQAADERFGTVVGFDGDRIPAPELPGLRLRTRGRR